MTSRERLAYDKKYWATHLAFDAGDWRAPTRGETQLHKAIYKYMWYWGNRIIRGLSSYDSQVGRTGDQVRRQMRAYYAVNGEKLRANARAFYYTPAGIKAAIKDNASRRGNQ